MDMDENKVIKFGYYFFGAAVIGSVIEMISTSAAFWKGEETSSFHKLVVIAYVAAYIITVMGTIPNWLDNGDDRYNIKRFTLVHAGKHFSFLSFGILIWVAIIAILSSLFYHVSLGQTFSVVLTILLFLLIVNVVAWVFIGAIAIISGICYKTVLASLMNKEKRAHKVWDPIMLEAVNQGGIVDKNHVRGYCINKTTTQERVTDMPMDLSEDLEEVFGNILGGSSSVSPSVSTQASVSAFPSEALPEWEFFIPDGLEALVQNDLIARIITKQMTNNKPRDLTLYKTKNPSKIHEVSEEISLDDD